MKLSGASRLDRNWIRGALLFAAAGVTAGCWAEDEGLSRDHQQTISLELGHKLPRFFGDRIADRSRFARETIALATLSAGDSARAPITNGTVSVTPEGTDYSPDPADRLVVKRPGEPPTTLFTLELSGDLQVPASDFLDGEHTIDVAIVVDGRTQIRVKSQRLADGTHNGSIAGEDSYEGVRYELDLTSQGSLSRMDTVTSSTRISEQHVTGTISDSDRHIDVDESWSRELTSTTAMVSFVSEAQELRVIRNRITAGDDELRWMDAAIAKTWHNGIAGHQGWSAAGSVLLNGSEHAEYVLEQPVMASTAPPAPSVVLLLPDGKLSLE